MVGVGPASSATYSRVSRLGGCNAASVRSVWIEPSHRAPGSTPGGVCRWAKETPNREEMRDRAARAETARDEAIRKLKDSDARSHRTLTELARITEQYRNLDSTYAELKNLLTQEQAERSQRNSELELTLTTFSGKLPSGTPSKGN